MVERSSTCQPSRASRDEPTGGAGSARIDHIRAEPTQVVLLERDEPLAFLDGLLAGIRTGAAGRLVLVAGEAGVGKTALLRRFCDAAGVRVLWGAGEPLRTPRPLGPLLDVADATGGELAELVGGGARPHEVAAALLRELRTPAVLVLEDVHWADEATLDVLTLLAARLGPAPALVLASYRDDEGFVLGEVVRRPARLKLEPLSAAAVAELAAPHGADPDELHRRTGGNPFFVIEALAAGGERLPDTVREAVLARAARLSDPARRLLEAVAVVPGPAELWLLDRLAGELVEHLGECLDSGMLTAGRTHVAVRHELARLAIEDATPSHRRLALHRAALAAHGDRAPDAARLAHHADAARDADAVLRWAPEAAERAAASGAHREAAAQYARALAYATELPQRAELLRRRADECYMAAQFDAAIEAQREALECHRRAGDPRREGDALRSLSRLLFFAGRTAEAEPVVLEAVELLERLPPGHELAMAYGNVSQRRMVVDDGEAAAEWGARALALADRLGDVEARVYALTNIGGAHMQTGRDEGRVMLERALALARDHGLEEYAGRAHLQLALCSLRNRRFGLAATHLDEGLAYCDERGLDTWRLYLLASRARLELDRGAWDDAAATAAEVLRDPRGAPVARGWALTVLGLVRARHGDPDAAGALDEAHAIVAGTGELMRIGPVAAARAEAAWLAGDEAAVERVTSAALALARKRRSPWPAGELAYWRRQAGLRDEVDAARPYALSLAGDWAGAAQAWREIGCPYEAALALADSDDDQIVLAAIDELERVGARPAARVVARRLRERGVRRVPRGPRPRTRENPAGLTARELEVLALLAEGLRNAQIAERLVLSEKTVGHHVSAVLRKLDARSRGEAATKALRLGLTG
jgi:DNA-binding CsgD family transcriptional regulator/tetratricopeptide (TPR) repeat protein